LGHQLGVQVGDLRDSGRGLHLSEKFRSAHDGEDGPGFEEASRPGIACTVPSAARIARVETDMAATELPTSGLSADSDRTHIDSPGRPSMAANSRSERWPKGRVTSRYSVSGSIAFARSVALDTVTTSPTLARSSAVPSFSGPVSVRYQIWTVSPAVALNGGSAGSVTAAPVGRVRIDGQEVTEAE
jgi:hypothetical protein